MIVENQLDRRAGWIGGIKKLEGCCVPTVPEPAIPILSGAAIEISGFSRERTKTQRA
jgi:hypothetical protein